MNCHEKKNRMKKKSRTKNNCLGVMKTSFIDITNTPTDT